MPTDQESITKNIQRIYTANVGFEGRLALPVFEIPNLFVSKVSIAQTRIVLSLEELNKYPVLVHIANTEPLCPEFYEIG